MEVINGLDFDSIQKRLEKKLDLDSESVRECCQEYRKFLFLIHSYPEVQVVPGPLIDEVWHDHILHTKKYLEDCKRVFGKYIHHSPSESDEGEDISQTLILYRSVFSSDPPEKYWSCKEGFCTKCCGNKCGKNCHTGGCRGGN
jgi:hypothetical protein